jgi:phosphoadenosine phosphosulfate reductase
MDRAALASSTPPAPTDHTALDAKEAAAAALLLEIARDFAPAAFASSLGAEDMVLTDLIWRTGADIELFTLDTGRLPEETYRLIQECRYRYGLAIHAYAPERAAVEKYVAAKGPNAFYESIELRKECCRIRKVEPLKRALAGKRAWITGLRREQAVTRHDLPLREHDAEHGLEKFNPLIDWTTDEVWRYIHRHDVPYNALHDKGYPSIGCAPCTRSITPGEDLRAGRWWWENPETRECGLHFDPAKAARDTAQAAGKKVDA